MLSLAKRLKRQRTESTKDTLQTQAQTLHHNHCNSKTYDDDMLVRSTKWTSVSGQGKWKRWKPETTLRIGFADPCRTARELASRYRSSSHSAIDSIHFIWYGCFASCL